MATGEKNDNTDEYCLATELLAKDSPDEHDYNAGKTKSQQKLKDLLTQSDNHSNFLQKDNSVTKDTNHSILNESIFNDCVHGNRNNSTDRLESISTSTGVNSINGISYSSSKVKCSLTNSEFSNKYGPYRLPINAVNDSVTDVFDNVSDSKLQQRNNNNNPIGSSTCTESVGRGARTPTLIEKTLTTGDEDRLNTPSLYEDANEFVFHDSTFDTPITTRFETEDEWEMAINTDQSSPRPAPMSTSCKSVTHTLFIKQAGTTDTVRQQITQAVGESEMTILSLEESFDVGTKADMYSLIWFHLLSPLSKRAIEIMTLLKSNSMKTILPIVVTNKLLKDQLPIQADLFVEPLTKDIVERLCSNVKASNSKINSNLPTKQPTTVRNFASTPESTISSASGRTSIGSHSPPRWCRVEHATKEKQRRERIKDSCDQLRVLLPYVKGRKTDMASILEMTVDYLKIVNSALSQDFHSQVIDIMSSGSPPVDDDYFSMNMAYKKTVRKEDDDINTSASTSAKSFHAVLTKTETKASKTSKKVNVNNRMVTRSVARSLTSVEDEIHSPDSGNLNKNMRNPYGNINNRIIVTKRGCSTTKVGSSNPKKPLMTLVPQDNKQSRTIQASTTSVIKDYKTESAMDDQPSQNHLYHNLQFPHMFTDGDISANRMFSSGHVASNDGFAYISHSQINLQSTHNATADRNDMNNHGNVYFDGPYVPYSYSNLQDSSNGNYYGTEYVNPNAVLPVTSYMPRVSAFASGRKFERPSTSNSEMLQCDSDLYNNNTVS